MENRLVPEGTGPEPKLRNLKGYLVLRSRSRRRLARRPAPSSKLEAAQVLEPLVEQQPEPASRPTPGQDLGIGLRYAQFSAQTGV